MCNIDLKSILDAIIWPGIIQSMNYFIKTRSKYSLSTSNLVFLSNDMIADNILNELFL